MNENTHVYTRGGQIISGQRLQTPQGNLGQMASNAENEITFAIALMLSGYDHKYNLVLGLSGRYTNGCMYFSCSEKTEITK